MSLEKLAEISRLYGADSDYVIAGGGNTSFKDGDFLYVKASGTSLAQAKPGDFVKMDRAALAAIWKKNYPADTNAREEAVLADMMAARCPGEESKRPSVETLLHDLLPFPYVVHTHPALVNGLTCANAGQKYVSELFPDAFWIPLVNPGYILSKTVKETLDASKTRDKLYTEQKKVVVFLQNHGIFVAAHSSQAINETYKQIMGTIDQHTVKKPDCGGEVSEYGNSLKIQNVLMEFMQKKDPGKKWFTAFSRNNQIAVFVKDKTSFGPVSSVFTPDHIVYSGSDPLFVDDPDDFEKEFGIHVKKTGRIPKTLVFKSLGVLGLGNSEKAAENAVELFRDTSKIAVYSQNFGGPCFMGREMINFINNWEAERYRSKAAD
ncbi:MAG: class II aldolase/adducin family protein [Treponema sp.]|nr:class II aldolase/adducin family protein [Treponema sp.]